MCGGLSSRGQCHVIHKDFASSAGQQLYCLICLKKKKNQTFPLQVTLYPPTHISCSLTDTCCFVFVKQLHVFASVFVDCLSLLVTASTDASRWPTQTCFCFFLHMSDIVSVFSVFMSVCLGACVRVNGGCTSCRVIVGRL